MKIDYSKKEIASGTKPAHIYAKKTQLMFHLHAEIAHNGDSHLGHGKKKL